MDRKAGTGAFPGRAEPGYGSPPGPGLGFRDLGPHVCRTMMLEDLGLVLDYVDDPGAPKARYREAVVERNCLGKGSASNRALSFKHLAELYALDPSVTIFRALAYFWERDVGGRPLIALLCAYARDAVLRATAEFALGLQEGEVVPGGDVERALQAWAPGRFNPATLGSIARRVNSTWTQAGLFRGRSPRVRSRPKATAGSLSYALFLGYLRGWRGRALFETEYARLPGCPYDKALELAAEASGRSWIAMKVAGDVVEVLFPAPMAPDGPGFA